MLDTERYVIATTSGYPFNTVRYNSSLWETEIMLVDRCYNCQVLYRECVRHRKVSSRSLEEAHARVQKWALTNL